MFDSILGNEPLKAYFRKAISEDQFPHALLFAGLDGIGKSLFARALALHFLQTTPSRIENETHPDFHVLRPEGKSGLHAIETLRLLIDKVHGAPFEAQAKVFVIHDAERMQPVAANALLKTLEEPTADTYLILLSSAPQEILPTICSRCSNLSFQPLSLEHLTLLLKQKGLSEQLAPRLQGSIGRALEITQREALEELLFPFLAEKRPYVEVSQVLDKLEKAVEDEDPARQNKNVDHLFASILMWHRDQHLRKMGGGRYFFSEAKQTRQPPLSLEKVGKAIDEARLAYQRNIKLSVCLEKLI